jgi:hypothetical protein
MAKVIEFHIPKSYKASLTWVPQLQLGKVIEFPAPFRKSA